MKNIFYRPIIFSFMAFYSLHAQEWTPDGFASVSALGLESTTGGKGGQIVTVDSKTELMDYVQRQEPYIIRINGTMDLDGMIKVTSNKTLVGVEKKGVISGGGLKLTGVSNVIIRNLRFENSVDDAITIENGTHHVWIDHCDLTQATDGLLDIRKGADFITVSWNLFWNHKKTSLVGHSDDNREQDSGHLRVTYHHNWFNRTQQRHPRVRFSALCHVYNNYFLGNTYGVASTMDANVLVEGNYFESVDSPTHVGYGTSGPGNLVERNNVYTHCLYPPETRGTVPEPPYAYILEDPNLIPEGVMHGAGRSGYIEIPFPLPQTLLYKADVFPELFGFPFFLTQNFPQVLTEIRQDPDLPENHWLYFLSTEDSVEYYWTSPIPIDSTLGVTVAFRIRTVDSPTPDRMFSLSYGDGKWQEKCILFPDGTCRFENGSSEKTLPDFSNGYTFRLTFQNGQSLLYVNEQSVPFLASVSSVSTLENRLCFGDESMAHTYGFLLDWFWMDATGAFSPSEKPIPTEVQIDRFFPHLGKHIAFVYHTAKMDPTTGKSPDQPFVDSLLAKGYAVTMLDNPSQIPSSPADREVLNRADLIFIGRSCTSADFAGENRKFWNELPQPLLLLQLYAARKSRLNWLNTDEAVHVNDIGIILNAWVECPDDSVFSGLSFEENVLPWCIGPYDVLRIQDPGNGTVLARSKEEGSLLFVRFEPYVEFYPGSMDRPKGYRTLIGNGNDNVGWYHYHNFTPQGWKVFFAEVNRMVHLGQVQDTTNVSISHPVLSFMLFPNYPNPFNQMTWISYFLTRPGRVVFSVYDVHGKEIRSLVYPKQNPGFYTIAFDGSSLASGVYVYRLETDEGASVRKMILLK